MERLKYPILGYLGIMAHRMLSFQKTLQRYIIEQ